MSDSSTRGAAESITPMMANPSSLGLFGLAIVTLVASSQKLGITDGTSLIIPWAFFLGASAQLYASIVDAKLNNTFGATVFGAFAFFWYSVAMTWLIQNGVFGEEMAANADTKQLGFAFLGYLIFSLYMTIASMGINKMLFLDFIFIDLLFLGLSASVLGFAVEQMHMLAAISEFIIAIISFYGSAAVILNIQFGKIILPVGGPFPIFK